MANARGAGFVSGFLAGAMIGAAAAFVLTSRSQAGRVRTPAGGVTGDIQASAADLYARGRKLIEQARSSIDAAVAEGKVVAEQTREDLQTKAVAP